MILRGYSYSNSKPVEVGIEGEKILDINPCKDQSENEFFIGPGFVDLQVNGYGGVDYNELYDDPLRLSLIAPLLYKEGVTSHLPTIITNDTERIALLIRQVGALREKDELSRLSIAGLHIEGPFIWSQHGDVGIGCCLQNGKASSK